jgi:hypothetical protein
MHPLAGRMRIPGRRGKEFLTKITSALKLGLQDCNNPNRDNSVCVCMCIYILYTTHTRKETQNYVHKQTSVISINIFKH